MTTSKVRRPNGNIEKPIFIRKCKKRKGGTWHIGPANDKTWRNFIIGRIYRVLLQATYLIQVYSGLSTLKADSPEPTRLAQSSSQAEQFRILMIRSVEISFSLSAEGHYQHGQLTFVHDACYDVSPSRLVELNSSLQLGSCLSLLTILQGCSRELKVPANDLWGYDKKLLKRIDKNKVRKWFFGGGRRSDITNYEMILRYYEMKDGSFLKQNPF